MEDQEQGSMESVQGGPHAPHVPTDASHGGPSSVAAAAELGHFGVWFAGNVASSAVKWAQWGTEQGFAWGRTAVEASGRFAETAILTVAAAAAGAVEGHGVNVPGDVPMSDADDSVYGPHDHSADGRMDTSEPTPNAGPDPQQGSRAPAGSESPGLTARFLDAVPRVLSGLEYGREAVIRSLHATERLTAFGIELADRAVSHSLTATDHVIEHAAGSRALGEALHRMGVRLPHETLGALASVSNVVREFAGTGHGGVSVGPIDSALGVAAIAAVQAETRVPVATWLRLQGSTPASRAELARLSHYMRFASAAYGHNAMRFMGYKIPAGAASLSAQAESTAERTARHADPAEASVGGGANERTPSTTLAAATDNAARGESGETVNVIEIVSSEQLQTALVDAADADDGDAGDVTDRSAASGAQPPLWSTQPTATDSMQRGGWGESAQPEQSGRARASTHHVLHHGAISHHTRVAEGDIRASEWGGSLFRPVHYVAFDRSVNAVVVTLRGTMCAEDILTDLVCKPVPYYSRRGIVALERRDSQQGTAEIRSREDANASATADADLERQRQTVEGGGQQGGQLGAPIGLVHGGFLRAAHRMDALLRPTMLDLLAEHPGSRVVVVGHSLGAGVSALLALLWADGGLPAHADVTCMAYATPCVASAELSRVLRQRVWSVVLEDDFVSRLSLGSACDLRKAVASVVAESGLAWRIIRAAATRSVARMRRASRQSEGLDFEPETRVEHEGEGEGVQGESREHRDAEAEARDATPEFFASVRNTLRADMQHDKLYPPGRVFWMRRLAAGTAERTDADRAAVAEFMRREESLRGSAASSAAASASASHVMAVVDCEQFGELPLTGRVLLDHMPLAYEEAIDSCVAAAEAYVDGERGTA
eukprot:Opistho-2@36544